MTHRTAYVGLGFAGLLSMVGCRTDEVFFEPDPGFERMLEQPRYDPFEDAGGVGDGRTMREPPVGTVPHEPEGARPRPAVTQALLDRGRVRFNRFCGPCHGESGYAETVVASHMERPPPSLHEPRIRDLTDADLKARIENGYGLMPRYAAQLSRQERYAVVAYLRALQLSQHAPVARLPERLRRNLRGAP